jgi:ABC-2 type transport system permease protein
VSREREGSVALAVVQRQLAAINPAHVVPPIVIPLLFFAAFAGALSGVADTPEFDYPDYTAFVFVFVLFMGTCFVAVFRGFAMVTDLETGFARRMMLAAPRRMSIILGFLLTSLVQALLVCLLVFGIGALTGMDIGGSVLEVAAILLLALMLNAAVFLFAAGVGLRMPSLQTGSLFMIMPVFVFLFCAPVYIEREDLSGWLQTAADFNPLTAFFEAGRSLLAGAPERVGLAFGLGAALIAVFYGWAYAGLRRVTK